MILSLLHMIPDFKRDSGYSFKMFIYYAFKKTNNASKGFPGIVVGVIFVFSLFLSFFFLSFFFFKNIMLMITGLTHKLKPDL